MNAPGAIVVAPLAAFTMPPTPTIGVAVLAATDPASRSIPVTAFVCTASTVTVACAAAVRGVQVPVHCPPPIELSIKGGSPEENAATTVPVSMRSEEHTSELQSLRHL